MTPLCLLEQMPQKHQVISVYESMANELFDQLTDSGDENYSNDISGGL